MMVSEYDKQAVGYTDMRLFQEWLRKAPLVVRILALTYPPSVYWLEMKSGDRLRVFPERYYQDDSGALLMAVIAAPELNTHYPCMTPHRITDVDPDKLEPIKWPPDAEVH